MVRAVGLLFKIKAVDRVGANAVRQARQEARHHRGPDSGHLPIHAVNAEAAYSVFWKILVRSRGLASSCRGLHLHHARCGTGDERTVGRGANARHLAQQLNVLRAVVEVVVAYDAAKRLATELAVLLLVDFF